MKRAAILLSAIAASGILIAGCGSSSDNALSKSEFIKQGNAICKKGNAKINAAANKTFKDSGKPTKQELDTFATQTLIPSVESQIKQIRDLSPPKGDKDQVNAILDEAQSAFDKGKADPQLLTGQNDPFKKANQLAKAYGLTVCGQ